MTERVRVVVISDVDMEAIIAAFGDPSIVQTVISDVMDAARGHWIQLAGERLNSSRRAYIDAIQEVEIDGNVASISLLGSFANMIEHGISPFDMRSTLLGPNVPVVPWGSGEKGKHKNKDGGYFRAIPFKHQTPNTIGQGGGAPMGSQYAGMLGTAKSRALGESIHAAAQQLTETTSTVGGGTSWGGRLAEGMAPKLKAKHSTDIYSGMVRQEKTYESATQNTYSTFRMISTSSGVGKWMHSGIQPANIVDDVHKYVEEIGVAAFDSLLEGL